MRQAVILAGGKGSRLKEISGDLPKSMTPVNGTILLEHIIKQCLKYNICDIKLLVSYKRKIIKDYFGDGSQYGVNIHYIVEHKPRGTAGALMDALPELNEQFLVIYGDTYFDIDLSFFWEYHNEKAGDVSVFLHPNDHPHDSDLVEIGSSLQVQKIHPYPHDNHWRQNLVNAAMYIFNKNSLTDLKFTIDKPDIAKQLFPMMLKNNRKLYGYVSSEYIKDMGTPQRLSIVERDISSGKVNSLKKIIKKIAIFLDRDGTINEEVGHLSDIRDFKLINGVEKAIRQINDAGILAIVITNQPVIARGDLTESDLKTIHNKMDTLLGRNGAYLDQLYYCPHHTDIGFDGEIKSLKINCDCRKPNIGLFKKAVSEFNICLEKSWMIGDSTIDLLAAQKAGMRSILVLTGSAGKDKIHKIKPDIVKNSLIDAVDFIMKEIGK